MIINLADKHPDTGAWRPYCIGLEVPTLQFEDKDTIIAVRPNEVEYKNRHGEFLLFIVEY